MTVVSEGAKAIARATVTAIEKLAENDRKPHWGDEQPQDLADCMEDEVRELRLALSTNDWKQVMRECGDVINFAAFIHDIAADKEVERILHES